MAAEDIGDRIGHITLAEVYAALAYYHANSAEIEADMAQQVAEAERIQLAEDLWDSILERQDELPLSSAQKQELDRRLEHYQQDPRLLSVSYSLVIHIADHFTDNTCHRSEECSSKASVESYL